MKRALFITLSLGLLATACDDRATRETSSGASGSSSSTALDLHLPPVQHEVPLSGDFVAKARAVQTAARTLAATCNFDTRSVSWEDIYFDFCAYKKGDPQKLHDAVTALLSSGLVPETGPASSFAEEARMFDAFVADAALPRSDEDYNYRARQGHSRGTLWHYQDLASAWNAMLPQDKVPVDEGSSSYTLGPPDAGGARHWERCGGLACVKRLHPGQPQ